jgi:hypothetical protein
MGNFKWFDKKARHLLNLNGKEYYTAYEEQQCDSDNDLQHFDGDLLRKDFLERNCCCSCCCDVDDVVVHSYLKSELGVYILSHSSLERKK